MAASATLTDDERADTELADQLVTIALDKLAVAVPEGMVMLVEKTKRGTKVWTMKQFCLEPNEDPRNIFDRIVDVIEDCDRFVEHALGLRYFATLTAVAVPCLEHGKYCRKRKAYLSWRSGASSGELHEPITDPDAKFSALPPEMVDALIECTSVLAAGIAARVESMHAVDKGLPPWAEKVSGLLAKQVAGNHEAAMAMLAEIHDEYGPDVIPAVLTAIAGATVMGTGVEIDDNVGMLFVNVDNMEINSVDEVPPPIAWAGRFLHAVARDDDDQMTALINSVENGYQLSLNAQGLVIVCGAALSSVMPQMYHDSN